MPTLTRTRSRWDHGYAPRHNTFPSPGLPLQRPFLGEAPDPIPAPAALPADAPARPGRDGQPELFVDLTSPWAYLAHLRFRDLADGPEGPAWFAVQAQTTIPFAGLRTPGPERERLRAELAAARAAAVDGEDLPEDVPAVLPNPRPVAAAYAEAVDLGVGDAVRDALLHAYWVEGRDIGDPEVLRRVLPPVIVNDDTLCTGDPRLEWGYLVSPAREPLTNEAYHLLEQWQHRWDELGRPGPLALVDGSTTHTGPAALTR